MSFGVLCDWTVSDKLRQNGAHLNLDIYLSIFVNLIYALRLCRGIWVNDDLSFRLRCLFWRKEEEVMVVCNSQPQCLAGHVCGWLYASERVSSFRPPLSQQRCRVHPQSQSFFFCSFQCHKKLSFADVLFLRSPSEIVIHPSKESDLLPAVLVHKSHLLYLHISSRDSQFNTPLIVLILITTPLSLTSLAQSSEVDAIQPTLF